MTNCRYYKSRSSGVVHVVDPTNEEFTLCTLAFDIGPDDFDDSGCRGGGPMVASIGPSNCLECKARASDLLAVLPNAKWGM